MNDKEEIEKQVAGALAHGYGPAVARFALACLVWRLRNAYTGSACLAWWILRRMSSPLAFQV
jgi:hypothetical protein